MGVWIEIDLFLNQKGKVVFVAPFVGVWIEICLFLGEIRSKSVAPFVGVWIEIC